MAGIPLSTNFDVGAALHLDSRGEITKAQMLTVNENIWPEDMLTICSDEHKVYLFSKSNTSDPETGKFREFTPGTEITVDDEMSLTSENPVQNKVICIALNGKVGIEDTMPIPSADYLGTIGIYGGATTQDYTHGYFYECVYKEAVTTVEFDKIIQCSGSDFLDFLKDIEPTHYAEVTHGTFTYLEAGDVWVIVGLDENDTQVFSYNLYTLDLEQYGFSFSSTPSDEEVVTYTCTINENGQYVWQPLRVQDSYTKEETNALLNGKVDKVVGKQLSTEDFTTGDMIKLGGIEPEAQVNTIESISVNGTPVSPDANKNVNIIAGGTAEDPIEYVNELPTSGIEDKIYGIKVTSGITKTIQIIKPIAGQLSKEQATAYFSQFFTVTEESSTRLSLSVYPDLVLSRNGWTQDYKAADGDIVTLKYLVDTQELSWTNSSSQETSTSAWSISPISCTSAYFPIYKYYAGVEYTQELNEIGAGGSAGVDIDNDTIIENQQGQISVSPAFKKIFYGTKAEWDNLTLDEKKSYDGGGTTDELPSASGGNVDIDNYTIIKNQQDEICINEEINPSEFTGTMEEWEALPTATKSLYQKLNTTDDDGGSIEVSDEAILGDMKPITSNGAAKLLCGSSTNPYTDCNNIIKAGTYSITPSVSNRPSNCDYGVMMVFGNTPNKASSSSQWIYQYFYETAGNGTGGRVYRRLCINPNTLTPSASQWTAWELVNGIENGTITRNTSISESMNEEFLQKTGRVAQLHANINGCVITGNQLTTIATVSSEFLPACSAWMLVDTDYVADGVRCFMNASGDIQVLFSQSGTYNIRIDKTYITAI